MTAVVVSTAPQGSDEWLAVRRGGIGGSDLGALLGHNPWRTPLDVWLSKVGDGDGFTGNDATDWGHRLEPVVRDHYASLRPGTIVEEVPGVLAHPDFPQARASLDGLAHDAHGSAVVEIKTTAQAWEQLPDMYVCQVAWYLAVTGLQRADVAVLSRGNTYREFAVEHEQAFADFALDYVSTWWVAHVEGRSMPDPDPVRDAPNLPRLWTPDPVLPPVVVPDDLAARLRAAKAAAAAAKTELDVAAAQVQLLMRESVAAVDSWGEPVASWSPVKGRTTVDVAALKAAGIYEDFARRGEPTRTFRVAESKG